MFGLKLELASVLFTYYHSQCYSSNIGEVNTNTVPPCVKPLRQDHLRLAFAGRPTPQQQQPSLNQLSPLTAFH